jgi:hypothetical protein
MHVCSLCAITFPAIESNDECAEDGKSTSTKKRRTRDKPLKEIHLLVASLKPNNTYCIKFIIVFHYALFSILLLFLK